MSKDRQNCNVWSQSAECRKFKKKEFQSGNYAMQSDTAECRQQHWEHQQRCSTLIRGWGYKLPVTHSVLDYSEVPIPEDSVIYCDIPYINTNRYIKAKHFDYERFYQWAEQQTEPVFISSYWMPEDRFVCIAEFDHRSTLCATANNKVTERIFIPKRQKERGNTFSQPSLYGLQSM